MGVLLVGTSCNAYQKTSTIPILLLSIKRQKPITILESTEEPTVFEQILPAYRGKPQGTARYLFLCEHLSSNERLLLRAAYQFESFG